MPNSPIFTTITELEDRWEEYRDAERAAWTGLFEQSVAAWEQYKLLFESFPSFPSWLRSNGHLG